MNPIAITEPKPHLGPCGARLNGHPEMIRVVSSNGETKYYKVYESEGPTRYGWYPQRSSFSSFWRKHNFDWNGHITFGNDLYNMGVDSNSSEWIECDNVWQFYKAIEYDHKTKQFKAIL